MGNTVLRPDVQQVDGSPAIAAPPSPTSAKLVCSRGEVIANVGDEFDWWGEGRWRIESFDLGDLTYSPSGFGGTPTVRCRPLGESPPFWIQYLNEDGTADWCGDSVGAGLFATLLRRDGEAAKREPSSTANTDETSDIHTK